MHAILRSTYTHVIVRYMAAPGIVARKFSMSIAALLTGGTVTNANLYQMSERDIGYSSSGLASVSRYLIPVAPVIFCAFMLQILNSSLGSPIQLDLSAPELTSFDTGGAKHFLEGIWSMMSELVHRMFSADWQSPKTYIMLVFLFSLSFGSSLPLTELRDAIAGTILLVVLLTAICTLSLSGGSGSDPISSSQLTGAVRNARQFLMNTTAMALIMMICGLFVAIVVGITVRIFELLTSSRKSPQKNETDNI